MLRLSPLPVAVALLVAAAATPAAALLSPFYERLAELKAILADPSIAGRLEAHGPIDGVEASEPDLFTLKAGGCVLTVTVETVPPAAGEPPMPGPRKFRLKAGEVVCP